MATIASHKVPGTTVTVSIQQTVRGYLVVSLGDPRVQTSKRAKTEPDARAEANRQWLAAKKLTAQPKPVQSVQAFADDFAWDRAIQQREAARDRAVAAAKMARW